MMPDVRRLDYTGGSDAHYSSLDFQHLAPSYDSLLLCLVVLIEHICRGDSVIDPT